MADVSVASITFAAISFLAICLLVLILLRHYLPLRSTPGYLLLPVFLALALPCSIILLVPIDLASSDADESHGAAGIWLPARALQATWRITYWLTFVLTWAMLPILGEYCDSGDRDTRDRMVYALKTNLKYQLITLGTAVVVFVYIVSQNGFHFSSLRGLIMALAYAWGLVLAIGLMGHGLVTLPRRLFKSASLPGRLRTLYTRAPLLHEKLEESIDELSQLEHTVNMLKQRKTGLSHDSQEWVDELADTCALVATRSAAVSSSDARLPAVITDRYLADLTRRLKRARHKRARFVDEWLHLCLAADKTQKILDSAASGQLDFGGRLSQSRLLNPSTRFYWHTFVIPYTSLALSILFGLASIGIVWSEVVSGFLPWLSLIGLTTIPSIHGQFGLISQLIAAAWLLYMCTTTLYALADVKVWGNRALVKRQTYGESACWYALQVAKLTVPLSYNFITMMPDRKLYEQTGFYKLLGQYIDITPLGQGFSAFFPCFILLTALATLFNLWGKASNMLGFGILVDDEDSDRVQFGSGSWREGKSLVERELQSQHRDLGTADGRADSLDIERQTYSERSGAPMRPAPRTFNPVTNEEEDLDDSPRHFYQDLGSRLRNTFDTADTPQWMKKIGGGFKTPRWAQRDEGNESAQTSVSRWFGTQSTDGRVRL